MTVTKDQIVDAAIVWKNSVDVYNSIVMAYETRQIDRLRYNDEVEPAEDAMDSAERTLRDLIEGFEVQTARKGGAS